MLDTKNTFQDRCSEIQQYIDFLKSVDVDKAALIHLSRSTALMDESNENPTERESTPSTAKVVSNETKKILKANVYLLLYNLVESTVRNTMEAIYRHLQLNAVSFHDIRSEFRLEILRNLKKHFDKNSIQDFSHQLSDITKDIVYLTFSSEERFSGNVDARFIRTQVERLGFEIIADSLTRNGADLLSIKNLRNSLAHGDISFCDCGKDLTASELESMYIRTSGYLTAFLDCTEKYLEDGQYMCAA